MSEIRSIDTKGTVLGDKTAEDLTSDTIASNPEEKQKLYKSEEATRLHVLSNIMRNRMMRIKKTIKRVYPELKKERSEAQIKIKEEIAAFKRSPKEEMGEHDYAQLIEVLTSHNLPYDRIFIRGMFLSLFSELDAFTEGFLSALFKLKPEIILGNQKQFSAQEILECDSIEVFKEKVIQKEIDTIKRESYIEQISIFEKIFSISTLKQFSNWSKYVEITQRRNIIMHNDGVVSEQYRSICTSNNVDCVGELGEKLEIGYEYLMDAISIIEEVSTKLAQIIWRKCFPGDELSGEFDAVLNETIFSFLSVEEWGLSRELGEFAHNIIRPRSNVFKMMFLVNYCIALNKLDKQHSVVELLNAVDFSVMSLEFLLAKYVLLNDIDNVVDIMKRIGTAGEYFKKETYPRFPLFSEIREEEKFKDTYQTIFGEKIEREEAITIISEAQDSE